MEKLSPLLGIILMGCWWIHKPGRYSFFIPSSNVLNLRLIMDWKRPDTEFCVIIGEMHGLSLALFCNLCQIPCIIFVAQYPPCLSKSQDITLFLEH